MSQEDWPFFLYGWEFAFLEPEAETTPIFDKLVRGYAW